MLGMAFLARQRAVVFDLAKKGEERVGIVPWEGELVEKTHEEGGRDRFLQFWVGGGLALGILGAWRWYQANGAEE